MEKFLAVILSVVLVIYLIGFIGKLMLRRWIYRKQKEFEQHFGNPGGFRQYTWTQSTASGNGGNGNAGREGEVKVQQTAASQKKVSGSVGDYVDYEEVATDKK